MAETGWRIEQACPQCGAPVVLEETDRLLTCGYCRVRLYIACRGIFRYVLPTRREGDHELLLVPYWRFKGQVFSCVPFEVKAGIVDMSSCAAELSDLPPSLGVRTQTVTMRFLSHETAGSLLRTVVAEEEAVAACQKVYNSWNDAELIHQAFVGDAVSIVYLPVGVGGALYDALADRRLGPIPAGGIDRESWVDTKDRWSVRFLPTLCPGCGWDLDCARDSLVLLCRNCHAAWAARGEKLVSIRYGVVASDFDPDLYLPFWRTRPKVTGVGLESYADLVRFANLPKKVRAEWETKPLSFWTPAFKVHPRYFLRIAETATIGQSGGGVAGKLPEGTVYPITLPAAESADSLKTLVAEFARPKTKLFPRLSEIDVEAVETDLVFLPFLANEREVRHPGLRICLQRNLLEYGKNL